MCNVTKVIKAVWLYMDLWLCLGVSEIVAMNQMWHKDLHLLRGLTFETSQFFFSTSNMLINSSVQSMYAHEFLLWKQHLYHVFCWLCVYLTKGIFAPPSVLHCAVILLSHVLAVCLGICSKYQKFSVSTTTSLTIICIPITFTFFLSSSGHYMES